MKLRNKKTGEILDYDPILQRWNGPIKETKHYVSLVELNAEWEDYEEPKVGYIVEPMGEDCVSADDSGYEESDVERAKELGIWFETKEEAEKAVEKLEAWKRLKENGFKFACYMRRSDWAGLPEVKALHNLIDITAYLPKDKIKEMESDLDLLFGGEE